MFQFDEDDDDDLGIGGYTPSVVTKKPMTAPASNFKKEEPKEDTTKVKYVADLKKQQASKVTDNKQQKNEVDQLLGMLEETYEDKQKSKTMSNFNSNQTQNDPPAKVDKEDDLFADLISDLEPTNANSNNNFNQTTPNLFKPSQSQANKSLALQKEEIFGIKQPPTLQPQIEENQFGGTGPTNSSTPKNNNNNSNNLIQPPSKQDQSQEEGIPTLDLGGSSRRQSVARKPPIQPSSQAAQINKPISNLNDGGGSDAGNISNYDSQRADDQDSIKDGGGVNQAEQAAINQVYEQLRKNLNTQTEEKHKQIQADLIKQLQSQNELVQQTYEQQLKLQRTNYQQELEYERQLRTDMTKEFSEILKQEKQRMREIFDIELQNKEIQQENKILAVKRQTESESRNLKNQLQQQVKLNNLMEDLRMNADKLNHITEKIDNGKQTNNSHQQELQEIQDQQRILKQMESSLRVERDLINNEQVRLERVKTEIQEKQSKFRIDMEKERNNLRSEINRLNQLQDSIRNVDGEKRREVFEEKQKLENIRALLEKERIEMREQFEEKYREFQIQVKFFESSQIQFQENAAKVEQINRDQLMETQNHRFKAAQIEMESMKILQNLQVQQMTVRTQQQDIRQQREILRQEASKFEKDAVQHQQMYSQFQKENQAVVEFKSNFENEKQRLQRKEIELRLQQAQLEGDKEKIQTDKEEINQMHKTLNTLKHDFVLQDLPVKFQNFTQTNQFQIPLQQATLNFENNQIQRPTPSMKNTSTEGNFQRPMSSNQRQTDAFRESNRITQQFSSPANTNQYTPFNLNGFMNQIKNLQEATQGNQAYVMKEKEFSSNSIPNSKFSAFN